VTLEPGSEFAGYSIRGEIGRGGMGIVYAAQHPRLPRQDALKIINPDLSGNEDFRQRFIREADIAARLDHPNIVHVYDRGEIDGRLWIATQYVDGIDAARLLRDRYPAGMPVGEALPLIRAAAAALDHAHAHGMLHRDVKPANILLSKPRPDGQRQVYLADFGIARPLIDSNGLTATNLTLGTVAYAAPEQLMGAALDPRADQYALACTAFHLLTGAPPYPDPNAVAVIGQHLNAPVPLVSNRRPDLPALNGVFGKALAKNPEERFGSCAEFAAALEQDPGSAELGRALTQAGMTVAAPLVLGPGSQSTGHRIRRKMLVPAVAISVVGAVVAAGIYFANGRAVEEDQLDGTYRWAQDSPRMTVNGLPRPSAPTEPFSNAFRSTCRSSGCVATSTELNAEGEKIPGLPTINFYLIDGEWVSAHQRYERNNADCLTSEGFVGPSNETIDAVVKLREQSAGVLIGTRTDTVVVSDCGYRGNVFQVPITVTRVGDLPDEVELPNPTEVPAPPAPLAPEPPNSPALKGLYRFSYSLKDAKATKNGRPLPAVDIPEFGFSFIFQSRCIPNRCAATYLEKSDRPGTDVFELVAGIWTTPSAALSDGSLCQGSVERQKLQMSFEIQPDGTLKGTEKFTTVTDECGNMGQELVVPFVGTREGDIPTGSVLADPALFLW